MKFEVNVQGRIGGGRTRQRVRLFCRQVLQDAIKRPEFHFLKRKSEISLAFLIATRSQSKTLNRSFRKKPKPAGVLAFPVYRTLAELRATHSPAIELGDIVICPAVIRKEARLAGREFYAQFFWMILHGILHVLGYDHERSAGERARMEALEGEILGRFHR